MSTPLYLQVRPDVSIEEQIQALKTQLEVYLNSDDSIETAKRIAEESRKVIEQAKRGDFTATVLRIDSSKGTVFKNNRVATVLSVTVFCGPNMITDMETLRSVYGNQAKLQWYMQGIDDDTFLPVPETDKKLSKNGFNLTLTADDVDQKTTFSCELIV